ncbi:MAG: hypothetical protein WAU42_10715 [Solirubrobacteraceae bacterium]
MLVFLGEEWESGSALALRHELEATAESLPGSSYQGILTQYSGLDGPISSPLAGSPVIEKYYIKQAITTKISSYAARLAAQEVIEQTGGAEKTDTTYAILPAPGTAEVESRTCGFHEGYGPDENGPSIAVIMDTEERIGCGDVTQTLTHEYAESITDRDGVSGWNTGVELGTDEIADICNELGPGRLADGAEVAWLWDDSKDACELEDSNPVPVPIGPYTETSNRNPSLEGATNLTPESERLETSIYPCDLEAHYYLEYGTTEAYGSKTAESAVPAAWGAVKVSATIAGLQHSIPYHWRVMVKTGNGTADGVDHEFTIPYYAEVKEERVSDVGLTEATLNGEVRPVGVQTNYYFEYGTTAAYGSKTAEASVGSGGEFVAVSAPLAGLAPGTRYHYRLVATNSRGTTVGEGKEFETLGGKPVVFTEPIYTLGYSSATLKGGVYGKGETTQYYFEYGATEGYGRRTAEHEIAGAGYEEEKEAVSGLTPGTRYHYRIVARNSYGTSYGADKSFSTPQEPLAETTAPEAVGYDDATLSGTVDPRGTQTSYRFEYGTSQTYGAHTAEVTAGSGTGDVQAVQSANHLAEDTIYHFRLVATTVYGTTYGADRTFTTGIEPAVQTNPPAPPAPFVESIVTPPATPLLPIVAPVPGPTSTPTPTSPGNRSPSLRVSRHGSSLLVVLELDSRVARVEVDATVPPAQLLPTKPRRRRGPVVLAQAMRANVGVGQSKLVLQLDEQARRALRSHLHLTLTLTVTIASSSGERQKVVRTLVLAYGRARARP